MPLEPDRPRWRALAAAARDLAQQLREPSAKEAMVVVAEQYTTLAEGVERPMTRALVRVIPNTAANSNAVDRFIIGLVGFLWGVLFGGFVAYWAPRDGDTSRSRQRAELCIEARVLACCHHCPCLGSSWLRAAGLNGQGASLAVALAASALRSAKLCV